MKDIIIFTRATGLLLVHNFSFLFMYLLMQKGDGLLASIFLAIVVASGAFIVVALIGALEGSSGV